MNLVERYLNTNKRFSVHWDGVKYHSVVIESGTFIIIAADRGKAIALVKKKLRQELQQYHFICNEI